MAASMPSSAIRSTESAAVSIASSRSPRTDLGGRRNTWDAPCAALGGLPTPMRTRTKSDECRCDWIERSPLCPASRRPPSAHRPRLEVELVVHDDDGGRIGDAEALGQGGTATPDSFMYVVGTARATRRPPITAVRRAPRRPSRRAATHRGVAPAAPRCRSRRCAGSRRTPRRGCPIRRPAGPPACPGAPTGRRAGAGPSPLRPRYPQPPRSARWRPLRPLLALALGGLFFHRDPRRLADRDRRLGVDLGRDALGQREVGDAQLAPMVSPLTSTSMESGWPWAAR